MKQGLFKPIQPPRAEPIREAKDRPITPHVGWEVIECNILIQVESDNEISALKKNPDTQTLYEMYKVFALQESLSRTHSALKRLFATQKTNLSLPVQISNTECLVDDNFYFNITPHKELFRVGSGQLLHWKAYIEIEHTKLIKYEEIKACLLNEFERNKPLIKQIHPKSCKENQPPSEHTGSTTPSAKLTP